MNKLVELIQKGDLRSVNDFFKDNSNSTIDNYTLNNLLYLSITYAYEPSYGGNLILPDNRKKIVQVLFEKTRNKYILEKVFEKPMYNVSIELADFLISIGANKDVLKNLDTSKFLFYQPLYNQIILFLLKHNAIDIQDVDSKCSMELLNILLEKGFKPTLKDLMNSVKGDDDLICFKTIVDELKKNSTKMPYFEIFNHLPSYSSNMLDIRKSIPHYLKVMEILLDGVDINSIKDINGNNLLIFAIITQKTSEVIRFLIEKKINIHDKNNKNKSSIDYLIYAPKFIQESITKKVTTISEMLDIAGSKNLIYFEGVNNLKFKKVGTPPYFGMELEIEFNNSAERYMCMMELEKLKTYIHMVPDESIDTGLEIVTDILDYTTMRNVLEEIIPIVKNNYGKCSSNCGFHIHIDKTVEIEEKVKKIFIPSRQKKLELIGLREMNGFCKMNTNNWSKYHAVNTTGYDHTIELRFFRCTLVLSNIVSFLDFARDISLLDYDQFILKYFSNWKDVKRNVFSKSLKRRSDTYTDNKIRKFKKSGGKKRKSSRRKSSRRKSSRR
jgi:hypothetical protein